MSYVFDNGPFSALFRNYYRSVFPTLWANFDALIYDGQITSFREVAREIAGSSDADLRNWANSNPDVFCVPTTDEADFIRQIYGVAHFQRNIEAQKLLKGGLLADPFVIAKAGVEGATVVTTEKFKPNASKIPNICRHFGVGCLTVREFMETENWRF